MELLYTVQELLVIQYHHKQLEAASGIVNAIAASIVLDHCLQRMTILKFPKSGDIFGIQSK